LAKLVNLTTHAIKIARPEGAIEIPPSGRIARARTIRKIIAFVEIDGIRVPINKTTFAELIDLPEPEPGALYIISIVALEAALKLGRTDVVSPDEIVRGNIGEVLYCRSFSQRGL
jgi:hypothetical protein